MKKMDRKLKIKILTHVFYGLGGSVILVAVMLKMLHLRPFGINSDIALGFGFVIEAIVFAIYGFSIRDIVDGHGAIQERQAGAKIDIVETGELKDEILGLQQDVKNLRQNLNKISRLFK